MALSGTRVAFAAPPAGSNWKLTFDDEFCGSSLDTSKWGYSSNIDNPDKEVQGYRPENVRVTDGSLKIDIKAETFTQGNKTFHFSSGKITTRNLFSQRFGYFEASIKLAAGKALWPAYWMLPISNTWPPELDILESWAMKDDGSWYSGGWYVASTVWHGSNYPAEGGGSPAYDRIDMTSPTTLTTAFHTYGMEWDDTKQAFYFDDRNSGTVTAHVITSNPFYMILQVAIEGSIGTDASTAPRTFEVDWVRVYEKTTGTSDITPTRVCGTGGAPGTGGATGTGSSTNGGGRSGAGAGGTGTGGPRGGSGQNGRGGVEALAGAGNSDVTGSETNRGCACHAASNTEHSPQWIWALGFTLALRRRRGVNR